jgi:23S rRNA (cytidine1920-2'-O)/16S rRNA (cytidine1409-2'-O)-methyltransferase
MIFSSTPSVTRNNASASRPSKRCHRLTSEGVCSLQGLALHSSRDHAHIVQRLDTEMVERGLSESREKAQRAIMAGSVRINGQPAKKPGDKVKPSDAIELVAGEKYVSRGGFKLEHGVDHFKITVQGKTAIDVGASTGGFTDCLLQRGATKVYAVDVGHGQLAWKLRQDPRVVVMEGTNARSLSAANFPGDFTPVDMVVIDCAFISLRKVLPPAVPLLRRGGVILALIKPQFEAGKAEADKGAGVIRDPAVHERVVQEVRAFVESIPGLQWQGVTESPILGPAGNKEFLAAIEKTK